MRRGLKTIPSGTPDLANWLGAHALDQRTPLCGSAPRDVLSRHAPFHAGTSSQRQRPAGPRKAHMSPHWAACSILAVLERSRGRRRTLYCLVVFAWSRGPHWGYRLSWGCSKAGRKLRSFGRPWNLFTGVGTGCDGLRRNFGPLSNHMMAYHRFVEIYKTSYLFKQPFSGGSGGSC